MVAVQHTLCSKCPQLLVSERPGIWGWTPYLPSSLLVCANTACATIQQIDVFINNNAYLVDSVRLQACADLNSSPSTYVCKAFASADSEGFHIGDVVYITSSVLFALLLTQMYIAWRRLRVQPYFEHRDLNISLRLYIWQTLFIYSCIYVNIIVGLAEEYQGCTGVLITVIQTPELAILVAVWCLSRNYLYTPVLPSQTKMENYRVPQTHLQQYLWKGGDTIIMESDEFWTSVLSNPTFELHEASVSDWKSHPVKYGSCKTLAEQPVFQFDLMLITMFWAKLIYAKMPIDIFTVEVKDVGLIGGLVGKIQKR